MLAAHNNNTRRKTMEPSSLSGKNAPASSNDENMVNGSPVKRKRSQSVSSKSSILISNDLSFANRNEISLSAKKSTKKRRNSVKSSVASELSSMMFPESPVQNDRRTTFEGNISGLLNDSTISGPSAAAETSNLLSFSFVESSTAPVDAESEDASYNRRDTINPSDLLDMMDSLEQSHNASTLSSNDKSVSMDLAASNRKTPRNVRRDTADQADLLDLLDDLSKDESTLAEESRLNASALSAMSPAVSVVPSATKSVKSAKSSTTKGRGSSRASSTAVTPSSSSSSALFSPTPSFMSKEVQQQQDEDQVSVSSTPGRTTRRSTASSRNSSLMISETNTSGFSVGSSLFNFQANKEAVDERRQTADFNDLEGLLDDVTDSVNVSRVSAADSVAAVEKSADISAAAAVVAADVDVSAGSINTMDLCNNVSDLLNFSMQSNSVRDNTSIVDEEDVHSLADNKSETYSEISQNSSGSLRRSQRSRKSVGSTATVSTKGSKTSRKSGVSEKSAASSRSSVKKGGAKLTAAALSMNATMNPNELTFGSNNADPFQGFDDFSQRSGGGNRDSICTVDLMQEVDNLLPDESSVDNHTVAASQLSLDNSSFGFAEVSRDVEKRRATVEAGDLEELMGELEHSVTDTLTEGEAERNPLEESMLTENGTVDARGLDVSSDTIQSMATLDTYALMEDVEEALEGETSQNDTSALTFVTMESLGGIMDRLEDDVTSTVSVLAASPAAMSNSGSSAFNSPPPSAQSSRTRGKSPSSGSKKKIPKLVINNTAAPSKAGSSEFDDITSSFTATNTLRSAMKPPRRNKEVPPSGSKRTVAFGSPDAAEFYKGSPTSHITPMHKSAAKSLYSMEAVSHFAAIDPEQYDQVTQENNEELDMWERFSQASGGEGGSSDEEEDVSAAVEEVQEKALRSRRLSKLQPHLREFSVDATNTSTPINDVSVSAFSDCTNTVALPANLADLLDQNDLLRSPLIPIKRTVENSPQVARSVACVQAGNMFDSRDISMEDQTEEIEGDLGALLRGFENEMEEDADVFTSDVPALNEMSRLGGGLNSSRDSSGMMDRSSFEDDNTLGNMLGLSMNRRNSLGSSGKSKKRASLDNSRRSSFELPGDPVELINSVIQDSRDFSMMEENTMDMLARHQDQREEMGEEQEEDETCRLENNLNDLLANVNDSGHKSVRSSRSNSRRGSRSFVVDQDVSVRQDGGMLLNGSNISGVDDDAEAEESEMDVTEEMERELSHASALIEEHNLHNISASDLMTLLTEQQHEQKQQDLSMDRSRSVQPANDLLSRLKMLNAGARNNALSQCSTPANPRMSIGLKRIANNLSLQSAKKFKSVTPVAVPAPVAAEKDDSVVIIGPFSAQKQQLGDDEVNNNTMDESSVNDTQDTIALPPLNASFSMMADVSMVLNQSSVIDTEVLRTNISVYFRTVLKLKGALVKHTPEVQQTVISLVKHACERTQLKACLLLTSEQLHSAWDADFDVESLVASVVRRGVSESSLSFSTELAVWVQLSVKAIVQHTAELERSSDSTGVNKVVFKALNKDVPTAGVAAQDRPKGTTLSGVERSVTHNKKLQHIVNRLTYCRLVTFQSHLIHIDVLLSPTISAVLKFKLCKSEVNDSSSLVIDEILVDLTEHSDHASNSKVQHYFASVLCAQEGPIGQVGLTTTPAQIPALLQKISCYVAKLRMAL